MVRYIPTLSLDRAQALNRWLDGALIAIAAVAATRGRDAATIVLVVTTALLGWWIASRVIKQYGVGTGRTLAGDLTLTLVMLAAAIGVVAIAAAIVGLPAVTTTFAWTLVPIVVIARLLLVGPHAWRARPKDVVLVVGTGPLGRLTGKNVAGRRRDLLGYLRFDADAETTRLRAPLLGNVASLEDVLKEHVVDEVYFASIDVASAAAIQSGIDVCERLGISFALPVYAYRLSRAKPVGDLRTGDGYSHFLSVQEKPLQLWFKRLFDIVSSGAALVVLSPLLLATAAAIKLTSPGPVLFRQERVGLHGRTFNMLKFRSMVVDADALKARLIAQNEQTGPVFKMTRDPRVTAVGRFIRKFSIDELPQLVSVLRGDMSIVGPRPPIASEVRKYEAWQRRRLSVRPGLTCVWQVSGRNAIGFRDWMLLDMRYIDHWSLAQDFALILRTVPVVLTGRGAS